LSDGNNLFQPIDGAAYLELKPFYLDPQEYVSAEDKPEALRKLSLKFERERNDSLRIWGVLVDPFAPIMGFSSILPIRTLKWWSPPGQTASEP
jgi:hypothetical protein